MLHYAAANGHLETIRYLFTIYEDTCPRNNHGETPLHFAVDKGHTCPLVPLHINVITYIDERVSSFY